MSKGDLHQLIQEARQELEGSNKLKKIREEYNKQPHVYIVSAGKIKNQILDQIKRKRNSITEKQNEVLDTIVHEYTKALYGTFRFRSSSAFKYDVFGTDTDFYVVVTTSDKSSTSDIYKKIYEIRKDRLSTLRNKVVKLFPKVTKEDTVHLLEIGHMKGHSISEVRIQRALASLSTAKGLGEFAETSSVLNLVLESYTHNTGSTLKDFKMYVEDEAIVSNVGSKSAAENALLVAARQVLGDFLKDNDWANQKGSNSAVEIALNRLLKTSKKSGAKITSKTTNTSSSRSSASTKAKIKTKPKSIKYIKDDGIGDLDVSENKSSTNWASLINIINRRLPEQVAGNMGAPALVYRTGRFANSTKVVNVETTKEGYPSIVYDYQRDPYDIFDRSKGASPWNTPARDPKALIDKSVREIVQEMAIGRFYTRRA
jgi:hypothetical protein